MDDRPPYRTSANERPLADLIPPDRRREKALALVGVGIVIGIGIGSWAALGRLGTNDEVPPPATIAPAPISSAAYADRVQAVIASERSSLRGVCWEKSPEVAAASIQLALELTPDGAITRATAKGDPPALARCIEQEARAWKMPPPPTRDGPTTVNIPFRFARDE